MELEEHRDERSVRAENALLREKIASLVKKESVVEARATVRVFLSALHTTEARHRRKWTS
jgi:hypothetical protein